MSSPTVTPPAFLSPEFWTSRRQAFLLCFLTLACLLPFCTEAVRLDDPFFIWVAKQIAAHPTDPYGFNVLWFQTTQPAPQSMYNPPLSSYYMAAAASVLGWSEAALHIAFLVPALGVIVGTFYLARRFTRNPLLAAAATLFTPGFLVSGTSLMCDTTMLAAWLAAILAWLEGIDRKKPALLALAGVLMAACALSKYAGLAVIPLLGAYTLCRKGKTDRWMLFYLLIPVLVVAGYEDWAKAMYGEGLLSHAGGFATAAITASGVNPDHFSRTLVGLGFAGGCALTALCFIPLLWPRRDLLLAAVPVLLLGYTGANGWYQRLGAVGAPPWVSAELAVFIAGGISIAILAAEDWQHNRNAEAALLVLWTAGIFVFAAFVNWTVSARAILPLVPAAGILLARRIDLLPVGSRCRLLLPLGLAALVSLWVTCGDAQLANSARSAAQHFRDADGAQADKTGFIGRWGFQYYMQSYGFRAVDPADYQPRNGNIVVVAENSPHFSTSIAPAYVGTASWYLEDLASGVTTMSMDRAAGFYNAGGGWGPLPYAFGPVSEEEYRVITLKIPAGKGKHAGKPVNVFGAGGGYEHRRLP